MIHPYDYAVKDRIKTKTPINQLTSKPVLVRFRGVLLTIHMERRRLGCQHLAKTKSAWIQPLTTTVFHAVYPKHFVGQALRRAFLCGNDEFSGQSYEHRKQWIVDKLAELANVFSIDICAYAVMSNHYHLALHINQSQAQAWSDNKVIEHWTLLFKAPFPFFPSFSLSLLLKITGYLTQRSQRRKGRREKH